MRSIRLARLLLVVACAAVLVGCASHSVDESAYVRANQQVLRSVPRMPGSQLVGSYTMGDRNGDEESPDHGGQFTAYVTHYEFSTPHGWDAAHVLRFYDRNLRSAGWTRVMSGSGAGTFLREPATLYIMVTSEGALLSVNHDRHADGTS
jgi:hypothetical protein